MTVTNESPARRPQLAFVLSVMPLAAGALGGLVMALHRTPTNRVALHFAGLVGGVLLARATAALRVARILRFAHTAAAAVLVLLGATLLGDGLLGVRRWITVGPVLMHASSIACPVILVAAAAMLAEGRRVRGIAILGAAQMIHWMQPDAGQSAALAASGIVLLAGADRGRSLARWVAAAALAGAAVATAYRADPLPRVPATEGIVALAADQGAWLRALAVASLALIPLALAVAARRPNEHWQRAGSLSLSVYVAAIMVAPIAANFPVPVMGFGLSSAIGVFLCAGFVSALCARSL